MLSKLIYVNIYLFLYRVFVDLGSFQVVGISTDPTQSELSSKNRPVLVQPVNRLSSSNQQKLLQVEFETNPLDKSADYRIKVVSQSLEIKYNAVKYQFNL